MQGIEKEFPGVKANDKVNFNLRQGEIHALLGENGAGKSTLMNILAGLYKVDKGRIYIRNEEVSFNSPKEAIEVGIGMVHQHFMLVPSQTVTENILLGLDTPRFYINAREFERTILELGERFGLHIDPNAKVWQLSVGEQQRVELLKMIYRGADILILDEPTAVLAPSEINEFFNTLRAMVKQGKSIIFISHKLQEVMAISDRVTILRKGKVTASGLNTKNTTKEELAKMMVGRDVIFTVKKKTLTAGEIILSVQDLWAKNDKDFDALKGVNLNVRRNEIVGLAGVAGNGQRELADVITGLRQAEQGKITIHDCDITNKPVKKGIDNGVSHIPEDRTHVGTAPNLSVTDNVIMKKYKKPPIGHGWMLNTIAAQDYATELKDNYEIIVPSINTPVRMLSGGNLQRVILAREISSDPSLLVAVQPTRGLDVGAIEGVHRLLLEQREAGAGILLISEELEELLSLSDRVYVIYGGEIMGEVKNGELEQIGLMMTGTRLEDIKRQAEENHG